MHKLVLHAYSSQSENIHPICALNIVYLWISAIPFASIMVSVHLLLDFCSILQIAYGRSLPLAEISLSATAYRGNTRCRS